MRRSSWLAAGAALVALTSSIGAALGPAHEDRADIRWPAVDSEIAPRSSTADRATADRATEPWFTPLLLSAHSPESLRATVPCSIVAQSFAPTLLFASTRNGDVDSRLAIEAEAGALRIRVGKDVLVTTEVVTAEATAAAVSCDFAFALTTHGFGAADWSLLQGDSVVASGATVPPVFSGFLSEVEPRGTRLQVSVTTRASSSRPSARQWLLAIATLVGIAVALAAVPGAPRRDRTRRMERRPRRSHRRLDATVLGALAAWWLLGPWFFDDGWLMATVRARDGSGSFSNYFDTLGAQMPLGFAFHAVLWPFAAFDAPFLVWRLVPLVASASTWLLVRRIFVRATRGPVPLAGLGALAAGHLLFSFAWLMTLRPEPIVALLSAAVCAWVLQYRDDDRPRTLGVALIAAALAATLHPSGLVASTPLLLAAPTAWRAVRRDLASLMQCAAMGACGIAAGVLLLFADTDAARWRVDRGLFAGDGFHSRGVLDEVDRYRDLLANGSIPALASVLVAGVALLAWIVATIARRTSNGSATDATPLVFGGILLAAVMLLTLTPSKWTYHFGSLSAFAALAIAAESSRVATMRGRRGAIVGVPVVVALVLVGARSFRHSPDAQYVLELGTPHPSVLGNPLLWIAMVVALLAVPGTRSGVRRWSFMAMISLTLAATFALYVVAPVLTGPRWAMPRAGIADLVRGGCPITRSIDVSDEREGQSLTRDDGSPPTLGWYSLDGVSGADGADVVATVRASAEARGISVRVEWAARDRDSTLTLSETSMAVAPFTSSVYGPAPLSRLIRVGPHSSRLPDANAVRLTATTSDGSPVAVSDVMAIAPRSLAFVLAGRSALVSPPELPLLRCTTPPLIRAGIAAMPDVTIGFERGHGIHEIPELGSASGPWFLAEDAYPTTRLRAWLTDTDAFAVTVHEPGSAERSVPIDIAYR